MNKPEKDKLIKEFEDNKAEYKDIQKSAKGLKWLDKIIKGYGK